MTSTLKRLFVVFCATLIITQQALGAGYYGDGGYVDAEVSVRYEDNLSRANSGPDIEEDMVTAMSVGAAYLKKLNDKSQLLISAYLAHERFAEFDDLNNITMNGNIVYTIQPRSGFTAPWYELSVDIANQKFNKSNIRDSAIVTTRIASGKRLSERLLGKLAYSYTHRYSDANVFDTDSHDIKGLLVYDFSPRVSLFGTYQLQIGEVVSTATPNPAIIAASESVAPDDVFSPGLGPGCMNRRCAYRLDAIGHILEAGAEIYLNEQFTLDLSGRYFIIDGDGLEAYKGWVYRAGLYMQY